MATTSDFTANRPVEGRVKNLLDDLAALDAGIPKELERGVRENYLEQDKVAGLAEKLRVNAPRFRSMHWVYVEQRVIQSVQVSAYDSEDALRVFRQEHEADIRQGQIPYGFRQSHWADRPSRRNVMFSAPTTTRPNMNHNLPFYVERREEPRPLRPETEQDRADDTRGADGPERAFDALTMASRSGLIEDGGTPLQTHRF